MPIEWHLNHAEFGNKPWEVQAAAMARAEGKRAFAFWMEMGLGKTALGLNMYVDAFRNDRVDICIVVAPLSFVGDWVGAPAEWGVGFVQAELWTKKTVVCVDPLNGWNNVDAGYLHGAPRKKPRLVAIGFEAARSSARTWIKQALKSQRCTLILDESTAIKNPNAEITKFLLEARKDATEVFELNGTPYTQTVMDYWSQLRFVGGLDGVNPFVFRNRFAVMGGYMGKQVRGIKNEEELYRVIDQHAFRALKKDWRKSLPPKIYTDVVVPMTKCQLSAYSEMLEDFYTEYGQIGARADMVLTQMDKLRQISSGLLMQDGVHQWLEPPSSNPKVLALDELRKNINGKLIVSHFYRPSGEMLIEHLSGQCDVAYIRGRMTSAELSEQKERFNKDPKCRVIVCQQGAAFRGHTLLGGTGDDRCHSMVFFENDFSYYQRSQMEDRNHRGAQDMACGYWNLVTSKIEQKLLTAVRHKKSTADLIDSFVTGLASDRAKSKKRVY